MGKCYLLKEVNDLPKETETKVRVFTKTFTLKRGEYVVHVDDKKIKNSHPSLSTTK